MLFTPYLKLKRWISSNNDLYFMKNVSITVTMSSVSWDHSQEHRKYYKFCALWSLTIPFWSGGIAETRGMKQQSQPNQENDSVAFVVFTVEHIIYNPAKFLGFLPGGQHLAAIAAVKVYGVLRQ